MARRTAETDPYEGLRTRAHWKRSDAERVVEDWRGSGLSMAEFARRHHLGLHRIHWWRDRTLREDPVQGEPVGARLVPAVVRRAPLIALDVGSKEPAVAVVVDGVRVELSSAHDTDPRWLAALVSALRGERA